MFKLCAVSFAITSLLSLGVFAAVDINQNTALTETRSTLDDQQSVAVTIYNGDLALVKDTSKVKIKIGLNALALRDVSAQIRPETALLRSINAPSSLTLFEQSFDFDLLTPEKYSKNMRAKQSAWLRQISQLA